jgi:hypothetical protein
MGPTGVDRVPVAGCELSSVTNSWQISSRRGQQCCGRSARRSASASAIGSSLALRLRHDPVDQRPRGGWTLPSLTLLGGAV